MNSFRIRGLLLWLAASLLLAPLYADARILKGPYLLHPAEDRITICWTGDDGAPGNLEMGLQAAASPVNVTAVTPTAFHAEGLSEWHYCTTPTGLAAGTAYRYRVRAGDAASDAFTFRTAPRAGEPFRLIVYGDNQRGEWSADNPYHTAVIAAMAAQSPDLWVHVGDMVVKGDRLASWAEFFREAAPLLATVPFVPVLGSHEAARDKEAVHFSRYFPAGESGSSRYDSFRFGNLAGVVLDLENERTLTDRRAPQREWFEHILDSIGRDARANLLFAFYHRPALSWRPGRVGRQAASKVVHPALRRAGAQIAWASHNHHYARAEIDGIAYVTTGGGGAGLDDFIADVQRQPGYRAHALAYHYCLVDVEPDLARVQVIEVPGGAVLDRFEVRARRPLGVSPTAGVTESSASMGTTDAEPDRPDREPPCGCGG